MPTVLNTGLKALAEQAVGTRTVPPWQYLFLDASNAEENINHTLTSQITTPGVNDIQEITTGNGGRKLANPTIEVLEGSYYKSVLTANWSFNDTLTVNGMVMINTPTAGTGDPLMRVLWPATKNIVINDTLSVIVKMDHRRASA